MDGVQSQSSHVIQDQMSRLKSSAGTPVEARGVNQECLENRAVEDLSLVLRHTRRLR